MALLNHNTPHDSTFKQVFSRPENALALLRAKLPAAVVDAIVEGSLEHEPSPAPDAELLERFTDVLMRGRLKDGREVRVYFLLEHQHQPDPWLTVRVLGYMVRIWEDWRRENPTAERLPLVIPLVLNQGPAPWHAARSMDQLYDATPELLRALGPLVPRLDLPILDLGGAPPARAAEILGPPVARLTLVLLRGMADPAEDPGDLLEEHARLVIRVLEAPGGSGDLRSLILYVAYVRKKIDVEVLSQRVRAFAGQEAGKVVMSTAQELIEKGKAEGNVEGAAKALLRQLDTLFGPLSARTKEKVQSASAEELAAWSLTVLGAERLEDVFAPGAKPSSRRSSRRSKGGSKKKR